MDKLRANDTLTRGAYTSMVYPASQTENTEKFYPHYTPETTSPYRGLALSSLSEALTRLDNVATWPPPTRRAAIGLWCSESGCYPSEVWAIAAQRLEVAA